MDQYGQLPLTLHALSERLQRGETFTITTKSDDGFSYALYLDEKGRIIFRQGGQEHPFRQLEVAVLTLLNCIGEFSRDRSPRRAGGPG